MDACGCKGGTENQGEVEEVVQEVNTKEIRAGRDLESEGKEEEE